MSVQELPVPPFFNPATVGQIWNVPYQERAALAERWAGQHRIAPSSEDKLRVCLVAVDVQNTFCIPGFELYVGGRSGTGAVDDNRRLCTFIYRNLSALTLICPTLDTHRPMQIFHAIFLVNEQGEHPEPFTLVSIGDIEKGAWRFNPSISAQLGIAPEYGQEHLRHYAEALKATGKYDLTIWPYHAMLGGIGHALVPAVEEAIFFHSLARCAQPDFQIKGERPLTEYYSVLGPEVLTGPSGEPIAHKSDQFLLKLLDYDAIIIAGQAKSHCVAWTIEDLLAGISAQDRQLAAKVYLLEDCTSPVVIPGAIDYTDQADAAFRRFAKAGMHLVRSDQPMATWPGLQL